MRLLEPLHQRQVVAVAAEQRHRGVGVAVDEPGSSASPSASTTSSPGCRPRRSGRAAAITPSTGPQRDQRRRRASRVGDREAHQPTAPASSRVERRRASRSRFAASPACELLDRQRRRRARSRGCRRRRRRRRRARARWRGCTRTRSSSRRRRRARRAAGPRPGSRSGARRLPVDAAVDELGPGGAAKRRATRAPPGGRSRGDPCPRASSWSDSPSCGR